MTPVSGFFAELAGPVIAAWGFAPVSLLVKKDLIETLSIEVSGDRRSLCNLW